MNEKIQISEFPAVSKTALIPLYLKAMDYQEKNSILNDKFAYDLYNKIEFDWDTIKQSTRKIDTLLMAIRARKFDHICRNFLNHYPDGIIVSLGSGPDNSFRRIDNNRCCFVDIDLPEVIEFKRFVTPASDRNTMIGKSILDYTWIKQISELSTEKHARVFFISEGVMMYFERNELRELFKNIHYSFPFAEIFFDMFSAKAQKYASRKKLFQDSNIKIKTGMNSGKEIEEWGIGFKVLSEWFFSNDPDAKKSYMKLVWMIPVIKRLQYFIHGIFENV